MKSIQTKQLDLNQTDLLCKTIANHIRDGDVFALTGELGAGKTTLVSTIAKYLDLKSGHLVSSPTYVIHHIYEAKLPIHHIDFYRLEHPGQIENLGFEEFLGKKGVAFIEWYEKFPQVWTGQHIEIRIHMSDLDHRIYTFSIREREVDHWEPLFEEILKNFSS